MNEYLTEEMLMEVSQQIINDIPTVSKQQFYNLAQPGDIILASAPKSAMKNKIAKLMSNVIIAFQKMKTASSKMVTFNKKVSGYGVGGASPDFGTKPLKAWGPDREAAILIRVVDATPNQIDGAVKFLLKQKGKKYNPLSLLNRGWNIARDKMRGKILNIFKKNPEEKPTDLVRIVKQTYICSNIISISYYNAGFTHKFNNKDAPNTWPVDFILDETLKKVAKFGL